MASSPLVFLKWSGDFCGPCKAIQPLYEKLAEDYKKQARFIWVEVDKDNFDVLINMYKISGYPTFHVFQNGALVEDMVGNNATKLKALTKKYCQPKHDSVSEAN